MKRITIDVDGVILDYVSRFSSWIKTNYPHIELDTSNYYMILNEEDPRRYMYEFWDSGNMSCLDFFNDSIDIINSISNKYEVHITTALHVDYSKERVKNLEKLNYSSINFKPKDKAEFIIEELKADIAIEDKPDLIRIFNKAGLKVYYPLVSYTTSEKDLQYIAVGYKKWKDLYKYLK